jgi:hypothetical protein
MGGGALAPSSGIRGRITSSKGRLENLSDWKGAAIRWFLKILPALLLGLSIAGCAPPQPPYPNVAPIDTTGNFGAR